MKPSLIRLKTILNCKWFILGLLLLLLIKPIYLLIHVNDKPNVSKTKKVSETIKDYKINGNKLTIKTRSKVLVYYFKDAKELNDLKIGYGYQIKATGHFESYQDNTIPYNFNNRKYQKLNGNDDYFKIDQYQIKSTKNPFYIIKNRLYQYLNQFDDNAYYLALMMGNKNYLGSDLDNIYSTNGVSHLLSISGLHLGILLFSISFILKECCIIPKIRFVIITIFILMLLFITNFSPSLLRASLLLLLIKINKRYKILNSNEKVMQYLLIILLLINFHIIFNLGFIFSYLCTYTLLSVKISNNKLFGLLQISFNTLLVTAPIIIKLNHSINILSIICNLILVPFMSYILLPFLLISSFISFLNPFASLLIKVFNLINEIFYNIKIFNIVMPDYSWLILFIYYGCFYLYLKRKKYLIGVLLLLIIIKILPWFNNYYLVTYLDVGQGDSILLVSPHLSKTILIDTGGKVNYQNNFTYYKKYRQINYTINYLKGLGINHLDYLVLTHGDYDHMGEAINLVENFKVEKVIFNCGEFNDLEQELIKVLDKKKIKYYSCIKELNIDKNKLYFLQAKEYDNENDNSNVIYTEINGYKFMFMGDASTTTEKEILNKYNLSNIDVLKVGHHGSRTSSSKEFIEEINPKYSIISVGKNNRYGHPNKEVLNILDKSKIYRTDEDGSIMFNIINNKLKIGTCSS